MRELETIVLKHDVKEHGLKAGDIGAIVHIYKENAFEVEFCTGDGGTVAVLTLSKADVRKIADREILHARAI